MNTEIKPNLFRPRWSKVWSDLWGDRTRTALVVGSIAVGVFAIGVILSASTILRTDIDRGFASINPPNIAVFTDPFDNELIDVIQRLPGVKMVEGRRIIAIRARRGSESWQNLKLVGVPDHAGNINLLDPIAGTQFPGKNEVILSQDLLHSTGYHVGDSIEIELPDASSHDLKVMGLVTDQTASKPDLRSTNNAYVAQTTLTSMGLDSNFNYLYITVTDEGSNRPLIASVADDIADKLDKSGREVYRIEEQLSTQHPMTDTVVAMLGVLGALGGLVAILSSSLIINTLNALLTDQLRQIGVMKLVGARSYQILGMYLTLIIAYGLMALVPAVPLAAIAGYAFARGIANLLGAVIQGFRVFPDIVMMQILMAILIPLGAGFFPVNSGARTSVQQAISNYRPGAQGARANLLQLKASRFAWIPRPILLSFRNTFRQRGRLFLTIFTLTMAGAVFIAVFNVRDSMSNMVSQLMQHFMSDVSVDFLRPYQVKRIEQTLLAVPGVKHVEAWGGVAGEIWDANDEVVTNLSISAPPQNTQLIRPEFIAGRWLLPNETKAIVVSDTIYRYYPDLKPGDSLTVKLPEQRKEEWKVVGVFKFVTLLGDPMAYADFDFIADDTHFHNQAASYRITTESHDAASQQVLVQQLDRYLMGRGLDVQNVQSGYRIRGLATEAINTLVIFLLIMALLTALVGSIGLTGTMSINVLERTREIGVMRTIGAGDMAIMRSVIIEGLVIGLITWILAVGLSFPISEFLLAIIGASLASSTISLSFTPLGILLWLAAVIVLSVIASMIPARSAARLTINEVLAYE